MDTQRAIFFSKTSCSGSSLEAWISKWLAQSRLTLGRLMNDPIHFVFWHVVSTHNLRFFLEICRNGWFDSDCAAQSKACLTADTCLTADPGIVSSILARSHTCAVIDHELISTAFLLPSADSLRYRRKYIQSNGSLLSQACSGESVVR